MHKITQHQQRELPCRDDHDTNALMLEPEARKPAPEAAPDAAPAAPAKRLSKSQKRKLKRVEEDKAKRAQRAEAWSIIPLAQIMDTMNPTSRRKCMHMA